MNERIRELAEQAEFSEKDLHIQGNNFQKFAELIVLDICTVLETAHLDNRLQSNWDDCYLKLMKCMGAGFSTFCREHFGVEP